MSLSTKQLGLLLLLLCMLTLTLAWIIERRQILSFRQELDAWGTSVGAAGTSIMAEPRQPPVEPTPFEPIPAPPIPDPPQPETPSE